MKDFLIVSAFYHLIGEFWSSIVNTVITIILVMIFSYMYYADHYSLLTSWIFAGLTITAYLTIQMVWIWFNKDQILANENSDQQYVNNVVDRITNRNN